MTNVRVALGRGFSVAVVVVFLLIGAYALTQGGFSSSGLIAFLLPLSFALVGAVGIWYGRYRTALVGTLGLLVVALLQAALLLGLAALMGIALVLAWTGEARERIPES